MGEKQRRIRLLLKIQKRPRNTYFLSVGTILPHDWDFTYVEILEKTEDYVIVKFSRVPFKANGGDVDVEV